MPRPFFAVQLGLAVYCLSVQALPAQEHDPQLLERFLKGVRESSEKLDHISFRAHCVCTSTDTVSDKTDTREYELGIRGPNGLQMSVRDGIELVQARNDAYAFVLHRSGAGDSLQFLEPVGVDSSIDMKIAAQEQQPRAMALAAYYLWTEPLARVVESNAFEIKRLHSIPSDDQEFVRVEFNYSIDEPSQMIRDRFTDGYLVCDVARQWIVKEYGATHHNLNDNHTATLRTVLEHGDAIGEMPIATKITQTMTSHNNDYASESVVSLDVIDRDLPDEELHLSHYGLPEPNFGGGWFGAWAWYLIAGIGCLIVSAMILKRQKAGA